VCVREDVTVTTVKRLVETHFSFCSIHGVVRVSEIIINLIMVLKLLFIAALLSLFMAPGVNITS